MKITIVGPRSVGKSTVSKLLAKKLNLKYISSDDLVDKAMKKYGGLDKVIKSGQIEKIIEIAVPLHKAVMKKDNFVYDLAGGAISNRKYKKTSNKIKRLTKNNTIIYGLIPYKNKKKSIEFLFNRENKRKHFRNEDNKKLRVDVEKHYLKLNKIIPKFCDFVIYVEDKTPGEIVNEILEELK